MVLGLSHITLVVRDLKRTAMLLEKVFDAQEVYDSGDKTFSLAREKFFLINSLWICLMEGSLSRSARMIISPFKSRNGIWMIMP